MNVLAGCDFFTVEVLSWRGLATYYVLFFIHLETRRVQIAGVTRHPVQERWMEQIARTATQEGWGYLRPYRHVRWTAIPSSVMLFGRLWPSAEWKQFGYLRRAPI